MENFAEVICACQFPNLTHTIIFCSEILFPDTRIMLHRPFCVIQDGLHCHTPSTHTHKQTCSPYQDTQFDSNGCLSCSLISPRSSGMRMWLKFVNQAPGRGGLSGTEWDPCSPVPAEVAGVPGRAVG